TTSLKLRGASWPTVLPTSARAPRDPSRDHAGFTCCIRNAKVSEPDPAPDSTSGNRSCVASTPASMPSLVLAKRDRHRADPPAGLSSTTHRLTREGRSRSRSRSSSMATAQPSILHRNATKPDPTPCSCPCSCARATPCSCLTCDTRGGSLCARGYPRRNGDPSLPSCACVTYIPCLVIIGLTPIPSIRIGQNNVGQ